MDFARFSRLDASVGAWIASHSGHAMAQIMAAISMTHSQVVLWAAAMAMGVYAAARREYGWAALAGVAIPSGLILNWVLKELFARPRPILPGGLPNPYHSYSFPSGHAAGATLVYGVLAAYVSWRVPRTGWRILVFTVAGLAIALVCISRLVLRAHYASDVIGGFAWAAIWVSAWAALLAPWRRHRVP